MTENLRVAIVTGAAGGIGRAMTRALRWRQASGSPASIATESPWGALAQARVSKEKRPNC
jgi:NAD(P)-dependent dehydrogenase (short-subunit alcohol dehydrogenase family)